MFKPYVTLTYLGPCYRGCFCDNWKPNFLLRLTFNGRTFSRWVTERWWHQWAKILVSTNQNLRNRWRQIVRDTVCIFITWGIFVILSIIYTQLFLRILCNAGMCKQRDIRGFLYLLGLKHWYIQNLKNVQNPVKHLYDLAIS